MKEYIKDEDDEDFENYNNINNEKYEQHPGYINNQIISPIKQNENEVSQVENDNIESNIESNKYSSNHIQSYINFSDDNINNNLQFTRYPLNNDQKRFLTPRNTSIFYKIIDFLFNW